MEGEGLARPPPRRYTRVRLGVPWETVEWQGESVPLTRKSHRGVGAARVLCVAECVPCVESEDVGGTHKCRDGARVRLVRGGNKIFLTLSKRGKNLCRGELMRAGGLPT